MSKVPPVAASFKFNRITIPAWLVDVLFYTAVPAALLVALLFRVWHAQIGLPYLYHWDEPQTMNAALGILKSGDWNPHFFNYGSLMIYANVFASALHYFYLMTRPDYVASHLRSLGEIITGIDNGLRWYISHPSFYLWGRYIVALMGTGTVALVGVLSAKISGRWSGLFAMWLLAILPVLVVDSSRITNDSPLVFLVMVAAVLAVLFVERKRMHYILLSAFVVGLAMSTKYTAAVALVMPLLALVVASWRNVWLWLALPLVCVAGFLLSTPYAVLDLPSFLRDAGFEAYHYAVMGQPNFTTDPGLPHLWLQFKQAYAELGWPFVAVAAVGIVPLARHQAGWLLLLLLGVFALFMSRTIVSFHRNWIILYPLVGVGFGCGLWFAVRSLPTIRGYRLLSAGVVVVFVVLLVNQTLANAGTFWTVAQTRDSRTQAILAVNRLTSEGIPGPVGIASELWIHKEDLHLLNLAYTVAPYTELDQSRYNIVLVPLIATARFADAQPQADAANSVQVMLPEQTTIGTAPTYVDRHSINPAVIVAYRTEPIFISDVSSDVLSLGGCCKLHD